MLFSRLTSCLAFVATLGALVAATPVGAEKVAALESRDHGHGGVGNIISLLKSKTDEIVPQIKNATTQNQVDIETVAPLISELVSAINNATSYLKRVQHNGHKERQNQGELEVAKVLAGIISDIAGAVDGLPVLAGLLERLDLAIFGLLNSLNSLLSAVLADLIGSLLQGIFGLLDTLGFVLTLGLIGHH